MENEYYKVSGGMKKRTFREVAWLMVALAALTILAVAIKVTFYIGG